MNKNEINQAVIAEIKSAIARSISHTEIVRVNVTG